MGYMKRKKSPNKGTQPSPQKTPVMQGDCFATFLREAQSIGNEVVARREFCADVVEFLETKGLVDEWAQWRKAKHES